MDECIDLKICFVGESGVGKTLMIQRYVNGTYNENMEKTTSPCYCNKKLMLNDNFLINLDLWDIGNGQEKYRSFHKNFIENSNIAILIYDISNKSSFEEIKNYHYEIVKECGEKNIVCGLAGSKCDLLSSDNFVESVSGKEVIKYSKDKRAIFQYTSNKENKGIDELILKCIYQYLLNLHIINKKYIPIEYIPFLYIIKKFQKNILKYLNY